MSPFINAVLIATSILSAYPSWLLAQSPSATSTKIDACSLVPKEDVKKYLPWMVALDGMPIEEEPIGTTGSSCNYPSVFIQVLPFSQGFIDLARKKRGAEAITDLGDEAYLYNNRDQYAELVVRVGTRLLTLQANMNGKVESVKPGVVSLAKLLVEKIR